ncbi:MULTISPECIES: acetolactate synthase large subunit [unclassified Sinorhizobium]|uniref:acetolactate synthase large subunit n=1 Tax=unclassified Sinorhizobium TaxID=2613772 RepID=UPI00352643DE
MNGAESLVRTMVASGVDTCFVNPGTSEMHFVAALDRTEGMRSVLVLFEGVATGAADGYWRMTGRPASTLLHLGPGLANALANIHNARKASSGMVNIIGEHATWHLAFDAPLASDIEGLARPLSDWVKTSRGSQFIGADAAEAIAMAHRSQIASLIMPGDAAWDGGGRIALANAADTRATVDTGAVEAAARALLSGEKTMIIIGGRSIRGEALELAGRIAGKTGATLATQFFSSRVERGAGRVPAFRIPYNVDAALTALRDYRRIVTVETREPVSFFAYPNKPSQMKHPDAELIELCPRSVHGLAALEALADAVGAKPSHARHQEWTEDSLPSGALNQTSIAQILSVLIPENAIVIDESVTTGRESFALTAGARPHDWLQNMGGSIGYGMPVATGAAIACPDRRVISLSGDGSAMYTLQALWTQAREGLNVTTLIFANRAYQILRQEFAGVGAGEPGEKAAAMLSLENPSLDFVALARGMGVPAERVETCEALIASLRRRLAEPGPRLIEVVL